MAMQPRGEETQSSILGAAALAFAEKGYDATGVAEICQRAGVSKGAFYHHFESKQAAFLSLVDAWLEDLEIALTHPAAKQGTVPDRILAMSQQFQDLLASHPEQLGLILEFWTQATRDEAMRQMVLQSYRAFRQFFVDLIQSGVAEGTLRSVDPVASAQVILSLTSGLFFQGLLDPEGADWGEVAERSVGAVLGAMRRKP